MAGRIWAGSPRGTSNVGTSPDGPWTYRPGTKVWYYPLYGGVLRGQIRAVGRPAGHTRSGQTIRWGYLIDLEAMPPGASHSRVVADCMVTARSDGE